MALDLVIDLQSFPMSWKMFCKKMPPFSIALDGYVNAAPCFDAVGPRINFNHHEDVDRLATRSTCAQVLIAIRQGLFDVFQRDGEARAQVYVNDCDEDVCLSWFLLKNFREVRDDCPERITRLVAMEDLMDTTAGAYPLPIGLAALKELAWIFEPYRSFRVNGGLDKRRLDEYTQIIHSVEDRIRGYLDGKAEYAPLNTHYKRLGGGKNWFMIEEIGSHARTGAYVDGVRAYVTVRKVASHRWVYAVGKMSPFVSFDVGKIIRALNKIEGNKKDRWGGANTIGGSPRVSGSRLSPREVEEIINNTLSD